MTSPVPCPERPAHPAPGLARTGWAAATALTLVLIGGAVLHRSQWDLPVVAAANDMHVGAFGVLTTTLYFLLDPPGAITLSAVITVAIFLTGLLRHRDPARAGLHALTYACTILLTWLPITAFKAIFVRPRPDVDALPHPFVEYQGDTSYPSGHTSFAVISVVALYLLVATTRRTRAVVAVLGACWVVFIVVVVVSNGVHFPTDSAASIVWGLGVTPFVVALLSRGAARLGPTRPAPLTA